jgi:hypothetical protein
MSDLRGAARPDSTKCCYTYLRHCFVLKPDVCGLQGESDGDEDATAAAADDADMEEEVVGEQDPVRQQLVLVLALLRYSGLLAMAPMSLAYGMVRSA